MAEYQSFYDEELGFQKWTEQLHESIDKIQRRLGGVRYKQLKSQLTDAIKQEKIGNAENFKDWIKVLLIDYYDPMYDYQLSKKQERVIFKGNKNEVLDYFENKHRIT